MHELVLDFLLRLGEPHRVVARVILPLAVARQMIHARRRISKLRRPLRARRACPVTVPRAPPLPPRRQPRPSSGGPVRIGPGRGTIPGVSESLHPENVPAPPPGPPSIDEIYGDLRIPDTLLSGRYANAVLIRHSPTEFSFDFITNIYPLLGRLGSGSYGGAECSRDASFPDPVDVGSADAAVVQRSYSIGSNRVLAGTTPLAPNPTCHGSPGSRGSYPLPPEALP